MIESASQNLVLNEVLLMILAATAQLVDDANKITSSETKEFFDRIEWPKEKK
jgi:hypothetical protein